MTRLPILDGDADAWGTVLNEFLEVAHHADGTLKRGEVGVTFTRSGALEVGTGENAFTFPAPATIVWVTTAVGEAPMGASILVDVNTNGTTIFSTQDDRPQIEAGELKTVVPHPTPVAEGDELNADIDQFGSIDPGADLTVQVVSHVP